MEPYQKGLDLLVEAISPISNVLRKNGFCFNLYGSDMEHKLEQLRAEVINKGIEDLIHFYDAVFSDEKYKVLETTDIFLIPSRFEGLPTGLLEALAYGVPALATDGSNMREEIDAFDAGWTAENTSDSIKAALLQIVEERRLIKNKGMNAFDLALNYDWDNIARNSHEIYKKLIMIDDL